MNLTTSVTVRHSVCASTLNMLPDSTLNMLPASTLNMLPEQRLTSGQLRLLLDYIRKKTNGGHGSTDSPGKTFLIAHIDQLRTAHNLLQMIKSKMGHTNNCTYFKFIKSYLFPICLWSLLFCLHSLCIRVFFPVGNHLDSRFCNKLLFPCFPWTTWLTDSFSFG